MSFTRFAEEVFVLYGEGKYESALNLAERGLKEYSWEAGKIGYWVACLNACLARPDRAIMVLQFLHLQGVWWRPATLRDDPDLAPLLDREEFQALLTSCTSFFEKAQAQSRPELFIREPEGFSLGKSYGLVMVLHWKGGKAGEFFDRWAVRALRSGFILAFPQSSQVYDMDGFCWDDEELAKEEIYGHLRSLGNSYKLRPERTILAGASQGARLAAELTLAEPEFAGFIAEIPYFHSVEPFARRNPSWQGKKGVIIAGDKDPAYPKAAEVYELLTGQGFPVQLLVEEGLGHDFTTKLEGYLAQALGFLFEGQ